MKLSQVSISYFPRVLAFLWCYFIKSFLVSQSALLFLPILSLHLFINCSLSSDARISLSIEMFSLSSLLCCLKSCLLYCLNLPLVLFYQHFLFVNRQYYFNRQYYSFWSFPVASRSLFLISRVLSQFNVLSLLRSSLFMLF